MEGPDLRVHQWPVVMGGVDLPTSEVRSTQELIIVGGVSVILKKHNHLLAQQISKNVNFDPVKILWLCAKDPKDSSPKSARFRLQVLYKCTCSGQCPIRRKWCAANDVTEKARYCFSLKKLFPFLPSSLPPSHCLVAGFCSSRESSALPVSSA